MTPTTAEALPSSTPISATTPEPSFFLNSSAMPLRSLPGTPFSTRPIIFTPPTSRTSSAGDAAAPPPPASASALRASRQLALDLALAVDQRLQAGRQILRPHLQDGRRLGQQLGLVAHMLLGRRAGHRLDAAHAGRHRALADDAEQADVAGAQRMGAAAQLDRILLRRPSPPIDSTRTSSPYFSPNSAMAPAAIASSGVISRVSTDDVHAGCAR